MVIENIILKQTIVAKTWGQEIEYQEIETIIHHRSKLLQNFRRSKLSFFKTDQEIERPLGPRGVGKVR
jgi:hypothetical protein